MGPMEQRGADIVKGMTGRSRGPGFEEGVLPVPAGAPPCHRVPAGAAAIGDGVSQSCHVDAAGCPPRPCMLRK